MLQSFEVLGSVSVLGLGDETARVDPWKAGERSGNPFPDDPDLLGRVSGKARPHVTLVALPQKLDVMTVVESLTATEINAEWRSVLQPDPAMTQLLEHADLPPKSMR